MSYLRDPYDTDEAPCFCGNQAPGPVLTTAEHCPACGDPNAPVIEPEGNDDEPAYAECEGAYETACPDQVHDGQPCPVCSGNGYTEGPGCNCGAGPFSDCGVHERYCGLEPCPRGCPFIPPTAKTEA